MTSDKLQINSNNQASNEENKKEVCLFGNWNLGFIWDLVFARPLARQGIWNFKISFGSSKYGICYAGMYKRELRD
ncbi:MAG: hypothetical protein ABII75_03550 [Candidatus Omnitrophota bacterium]